MKGILRDLLSIGHPKETPERQWQEIIQVRRKVQELERRMHLSEQHRYILRPLGGAAAQGFHAAREEDGS